MENKLKELIEYKQMLAKETREINKQIDALVGELISEKFEEVGQYKITEEVFQSVTERQSFNTSTFKKDYPKLYNEYLKTSLVRKLNLF